MNELYLIEYFSEFSHEWCATTTASHDRKIVERLVDQMNESGHKSRIKVIICL